jgi:hypothetical protein
LAPFNINEKYSITFTDGIIGYTAVTNIMAIGKAKHEKSLATKVAAKNV